MKNPSWECLEVNGGLALRGVAAALPEAFEQAAQAMGSLAPAADGAAETTPVEFTCEGADYGILLYQWLTAVAREMNERSLVFGRFDVKIEGRKLAATGWAKPAAAGPRAPFWVTLRLDQLRVCPLADGGWIAQCAVQPPVAA